MGLFLVETTFHRARDALFMLCARCRDIYATPPPIRAILLVSMKSLIQAISEAEHEIETAQN